MLVVMGSWRILFSFKIFFTRLSNVSDRMLDLHSLVTAINVCRCSWASSMFGGGVNCIISPIQSKGFYTSLVAFQDLCVKRIGVSLRPLSSGLDRLPPNCLWPCGSWVSSCTWCVVGDGLEGPKCSVLLSLLAGSAFGLRKVTALDAHLAAEPFGVAVLAAAFFCGVAG